MRHTHGAAGVFFLLLLFATQGMAQTSPPEQEVGEYDTDSGDWNGVRDFITLAQGEGVEVITHATLDFDTLELTEPVLVAFPKNALRGESLARFVIDGGRVILADDFGQSSSFLEQLDISRVEPLQGALPHDEFLERNPGLPVVRSRGAHPLLEDVQFVVANHPAVLFNVGGPVLAYSEDGGLVYDMNLGQGKAVVVGDASMLINHMLLIGDNGTFWRNALRYVCANQSPCRLHMVVGDFDQQGSWGREDELLGDREAILENVRAFNESLSELMARVPAEQLFYYLSILLAIGLGIYLYTIFPMRRTRPYSAYLSDARASVHPPQSEFDWNLARFAHGASSMNYALPVSILKEIFEELFLKEMGCWEQGMEQRPKIPEIGEQFATRYLELHSPDEVKKLRAQLVELLATFAGVPTRHRVFLDSDTYFSERDLIKIHTKSLEILAIMGLKEAYERRTRSHI